MRVIKIINIILNKIDLIKRNTKKIFIFVAIVFSPVMILFFFFLYFFPVIEIIHKFKSYYFSSSLKEFGFLSNIIGDSLQGKLSYLGVMFILLIIISVVYQSYYYYKSFVYSKIPWWSPEKWSFYITVFILVFIHLQTFGSYSYNIEEGNYPDISKEPIDFLKVFPTIVISYILIIVINNLYVNFKESFKEIFYLCILVVLTTYIFNDDNWNNNSEKSYILHLLSYSFFSIVTSLLNFLMVIINYYYIPIFFISILNLSYITFTFNIIFSVIFYIENGEISFYILFMRIVDIINTFDVLNLPSIVAIIAFLANLISVFFTFLPKFKE